MNGSHFLEAGPLPALPGRADDEPNGEKRRWSSKARFDFSEFAAGCRPIRFVNGTRSPMAKARERSCSATPTSSQAWPPARSLPGAAEAAFSNMAEMPCAHAAWSGSWQPARRSEEHTSELQSLMRISYAVFCLKKKKTKND